jgi:Flp pilus assembly protein TadB
MLKRGSQMASFSDESDEDASSQLVNSSPTPGGMRSSPQLQSGMFLSVLRSLCVCVCLFVFVFVSVSVSLVFCLCLYVCLTVCLFVCCVSVYVPVCV